MSSGREEVAPVGDGHEVSRAPTSLAWRSLSSGQAASRRGESVEMAGAASVGLQSDWLGGGTGTSVDSVQQLLPG